MLAALDVKDRARRRPQRVLLLPEREALGVLRDLGWRGSGRPPDKLVCVQVVPFLHRDRVRRTGELPGELVPGSVIEATATDHSGDEQPAHDGPHRQEDSKPRREVRARGEHGVIRRP